MKRAVSIILVLILSVTLVACAQNTKSSNKSINESNVTITSENSTQPDKETKNSISEFSPDDFSMCDVDLDMKKEEVEKLLGKPNKSKSTYEEAFGADVFLYYYDFGTIRLEPDPNDVYTVSSIKILKPNYNGVRGIKIGDSVDEVIKKFPCNKYNSINADSIKILYGKEHDAGGFIHYENNKVIDIIYLYGPEGFGGYALYLVIEDNVVKKISLSVTNM